MLKKHPAETALRDVLATAEIRLGEVYGSAGLTKETARLFIDNAKSRFVETDHPPYNVYIANLLLIEGDLTDYRQFCEHLASKYANKGDKGLDNIVLHAAGLGPSGQALTSIRNRMATSLETVQTDRFDHIPLFIFAYQSGRLEEARQRYERLTIPWLPTSHWTGIQALVLYWTLAIMPLSERVIYPSFRADCADKEPWARFLNKRTPVGDD